MKYPVVFPGYLPIFSSECVGTSLADGTPISMKKLPIRSAGCWNTGVVWGAIIFSGPCKFQQGGKPWLP